MRCLTSKESNAITIDQTVAKKVLEVVDAGLVSGLGRPVPGQMCVEAAVCYAMGLPHSDEPDCVASSLRALKIQLNDSAWSSDQARSNGMRRLALLQLGSAGVLDEQEFARRVVIMTVRMIVPRALRSTAVLHSSPIHRNNLEQAAVVCEQVDGAAAAAARAAAAAAAAAAARAAAAAAGGDNELVFFADQVAQILVDMNVPGVQWLNLL